MPYGKDKPSADPSFYDFQTSMQEEGLYGAGLQTAAKKIPTFRSLIDQELQRNFQADERRSAREVAEREQRIDVDTFRNMLEPAGGGVLLGSGHENSFIREGTAGVMQGALELGSLAARPFSKSGSDRLLGLSDAAGQASEELIGEHDTFSPTLSRAWRGAARSGSQMAAGGAAGLGAYGLAGLSGLNRYNRALYEADQAGITGSARQRYALIQGSIEAGVTSAFNRMGLGGLEAEAAIRGGVSGGLKESLKRVGISTLQEMPEELTIELADSVVSAVSGVDPEALSPESLKETVIQTFLQTAMMGGIVGTPGIIEGAANSLQNRRNVESTESTISAPESTVSTVPESTESTIPAEPQQAAPVDPAAFVAQLPPEVAEQLAGKTSRTAWAKALGISSQEVAAQFPLATRTAIAEEIRSRAQAPETVSTAVPDAGGEADPPVSAVPAPEANPQEDLAGAFGGLGGGAVDNLYGAWRDSILQTGEMPSTERRANTLANQAWGKVLQAGYQNDEATVDAFIENARKHGLDSKENTSKALQEFALQMGPPPGHPEAQAPPALPASIPDRIGPVTAQQVQTVFQGSTLEPLETGDGWRVRLPNQKHVDVRITNDIVVRNWPKFELTRGKQYSPEERARLSLAGSFKLSVPGQDITGLGLIRINAGLKSDAAPKVLRHEALHLAKATGLLTEQEWNALVTEYSDPSRPEKRQEEDIAKAVGAWKGQEGLANKVLEMVQAILRPFGFDKIDAADVQSLFGTEGFWSRESTNNDDVANKGDEAKPNGDRGDRVLPAGTGQDGDNQPQGNQDSTRTEKPAPHAGESRQSAPVGKDDQPKGEELRESPAGEREGNELSENKRSKGWNQRIARKVLKQAAASPTGRFGQKIFINHAFGALDPELKDWFGTVGDFKTWLKMANREGWIALSRADLVEAMDPADVRESETKHLTATWHFIQIPEVKANVDKTRTEEETGRPGGDRAPSGRTLAETSTEADGKPGSGGDAVRPSGGSRTEDAGPQRPAVEERDADERSPQRSDEADDSSSRQRVAPVNFRITPDDKIGEGGPKAKVRANIEAIKLLNRIEAAERLATPDEQKILAKYVGWGAFAQDVFANKKGWEAETKELKRVLSTEEYDSAKRSTINAHYTSPEVISGIWKGLESLGIRGGKILEPGMGVGNFYGLMPEGIMGRSGLYGVELDSITGRIAQQLYQTADVKVMGFQDAKLPQGYFDLIISNVPFADVRITDKNDRELSQERLALHDYYFAKSMKLARPGGVVAFITSRYTMDKAELKVRDLISRLGGDLLGAVRLPRTAFKGNAGTEVVTDLIVLQKRAEGEKPAGEDWTATETIDAGGHDQRVNRYWVDHPNHVLGTHSSQGSMYAKNEYTVDATEGVNLGEKIGEILATFKASQVDATESRTEKLREAEVRRASSDHLRDGNISVDGDKAFEYRQGSLHEIPAERLPYKGKRKTIFPRLSEASKVRDAVRTLLRLQVSQTAGEADVVAARTAANDAYDKFVKEFGALNSKENRTVLAADVEAAPLLRALEDWDEDTQKATKAKILTERTQFPVKKISRADGPSESLVASLAEYGRVDLPYMSQLLNGKPEEEIAKELTGQIFQNPITKEWETATAYLAGNVRRKLEQAKKAGKGFEANVKSLEKVQPEDVSPADISVRLGSPWIPPEDYQAFFKEVLGAQAKVGYVAASGTWTFNWFSGGSPQARSDFGTADMGPTKIADAVMNHRSLTVYKWVDKDTKVVDEDGTRAVQIKAEALKAKFAEWLWTDKARTSRLHRFYNDNFNNIVIADYDGSHQSFPGMSEAWKTKLRGYQKNTIWRTVSKPGNGLFAHVVGAGKSIQSFASVMELRRLGLVKKPVFVVPNHLVAQMPAEFLQAYPSAKLLVAAEGDLSVGSKSGLPSGQRQIFMNRIATGDYDAIFVPHSSFEKIPLSPRLQEGFFREQIATIEEAENAAREAGGKKDRTVKELEKAKARLEEKLERLQADWKKDTGPYFDELGVDMLVVDEAHEFKNLFIHTKMNNLPGIGSGEGAQKSFDMWMKTSHLNRTKGKVLFMTGTPIANSVSEMYTMMRYLMPNTLKENGLEAFDAWADTFGDTVTQAEVKPDGSGVRMHTRFAKFANLPELMSMFRDIADVKMVDALPDLKAARPPLKGGKPSIVEIPRSGPLDAFVKNLAKRAEAIKGKRAEKGSDNMLSITTDGRKAALALRLVGLPEDPNGKLTKAADNVAQIWEQTKKDKLAQLIWCDLGTPGTKVGINLYADMKQKLIERGVAEKEIAFIHDAKDDKQRANLFKKVREGKIRVLMANTPKLATGANIQAKLVAAHHLDVPWKPAELEQRDGRILRPGNLSPQAKSSGGHVQIFRYVSKGSFDSYNWQTIETKAKFIAQAMSGGTSLRSMDDLDEVALTAAEVKAIATDNPAMMEWVKLDADVKRMESERKDFQRQSFSAQQGLERLPGEVEQTKRRIAGIKQDLKNLKDEADFAMEIRGVLHTERKSAGQAILDVVAAAESEQLNRGIPLGSYRGLPLYVYSSIGSTVPTLALKGGAMDWDTQMGNDPLGTVSRITNIPTRIPATLKTNEGLLAQTEERLAFMTKRAEQKWDREDEFQAKKKKVAELYAKLQAADKAASNQNELPEQELRSAIYWGGLDSVGGRENVRVRLADIRKAVPAKFSKLQVDEMLIQMERDGLLSLMQLDNPREITADDKTAVLMTGTGSPRHIAYIGGQSSQGKVEPPPRPKSAAEQAQEKADEDLRPEIEGEAFGIGLLPRGLRKKRPSGVITVPAELAVELPDIEKRLSDARGVKPKSLRDRVDNLIDALRRATRPQASIPENSRFASANETFRLLKAVPDAVKDETTRVIAAIVDPLSSKNIQLMERFVIAENMLASVDRGEPLRFGFEDRDQVERYLDRLKKLVEANPDVREALDTRKKIVHELVERLVAADMLPGDALSRSASYFHQQVLSKLQSERATAGDRLARYKRGFQRKRVVGHDEFLNTPEFDYNTSYIESEFSWMVEAEAKLRTRKWIDTLNDKFGILKRLKAEAKEANWVKVVGGPDAAKKIRKLEMRLEEDDLDKETRDTINAELDELDPFRPFRKRIAWNASRIRRIYKKQLQSQFDPDNPDGPWWALLRQLANEELPDAPDVAVIAARSIYKAIGERKKMVEETLGDELVTWESLVRENPGYSIWQPVPGSVFFSAFTIPEKIAAMVQEGIYADLVPEDIRKVIALGGPKEQWVLPNEIVEQLDSMEVPKPDGPISSIAAEIQRGWKVWTLLNPKRIVGYFLRNMGGDTDVTIAGAPGVAKYIPRAIEDLKRYHGPNVSITGPLREARDLAVIGSSMTANDIPDIKSLRLLKRFLTDPDQNANLAGQWFEKAKAWNEFRENTIRYAAYLHYKDQLENNSLKHFGGANRAVVENLKLQLGTNVAAAHLARNLLGDYGNISQAGEWLRKYLIPFWSWNEINLRRYPRIAVNAWKSGDKKTQGKAAALYSAVAVGRIGAVYAGLAIYNHLFWPDEEDELTPEERAQPHLILGRRDDGSIIVLRNVAAVGDFLEWAGIPTLMGLAPKFLADQLTMGDLVAETAKAPLNKGVSGVNPFYKAVPEVGAGLSFFPDATNPRSVARDEAAAGILGLRDELLFAKGLILQDGSTARQGYVTRLIGVSDPRQNALHAIYDARDRWLVKQGKETTGSFAKSKVAVMRDAARAEDYDNFVKARRKYLENGGDTSKFLMSLNHLDPLNRVSDDEEFRKFLTADQRTKLDEVRTYAKELELRMFAWWHVAAAESGDQAQQAEAKETIDRKLVNHAKTLVRVLPLAKSEREKVIAEKTAAMNWLRERQIDPVDVLDAYRRLHSSQLKDRDNATAGEIRLRAQLRDLSSGSNQETTNGRKERRGLVLHAR